MTLKNTPYSNSQLKNRGIHVQRYVDRRSIDVGVVYSFYGAPCRPELPLFGGLSELDMRILEARACNRDYYLAVLGVSYVDGMSDHGSTIAA